MSMWAKPWSSRAVCVLLLIGSATARCTCGGVSAGTEVTSVKIQPLFLDYTAQECERACCDFPGCVGFDRADTELYNTVRGDCQLYKSGSMVTATPGKTFVTVGSVQPKCQVTNLLLGQVCSAFTDAGTQTSDQCKSTCCLNPSCLGYSMSIAAYGLGTGTCKLCTDLAVPTASESDMIVDLSGCARQPERPELPCSRGDPRFSITPTDVWLSNGADPQTLFALPANDDFDAYDSAYFDLGTKQLVGMVSIIAPRQIVTNAAGDLPSPGEGFILMVGDYDDCKSYSNTPPECPVCGSVVSVSSNDLYEIDCRGLRGRYLHIFAPFEFSTRRIRITSIAVQSAPYFPPVPPSNLNSAQHVLGNGAICCNQGDDTPISLTASQWEGTTSISVSNGEGNVYSPWVQASLGPVALPVGDVEFSFPYNALSTMFQDLRDRKSVV